MLRRGEAGHRRTCVGYGIHAGPQRDGVREREEGMSTRQAAQRGGTKTDQENSQFLFSLLLLCQQLNLCYAYTVLLYVNVPAHTNLGLYTNEPPSVNSSFAVLICGSLLSSVHFRSPEYAECTW